MAEEIKAVETNEQVESTPQENVQDTNEVTANSVEQESVQVEEQQAKQQSKEDNSKFARMRREKEQEEKINAAKYEAKIQAIIEEVGKNPYTEKPLEDAKDVEQYLIMKQIDKDGGNPLNDYPEYQKKAEIKKENDEKANAEAKQKNIDDVKDFVSKYPNVNLEELGKDVLFEEYCGDRLGKVPLADLYKSYKSFTERVGANNLKMEQDKQAMEQAKKNASVGELGTPNQADDGIYTLEQLKTMTTKELEKNWDKVLRSRKKYNI